MDNKYNSEKNEGREGFGSILGKAAALAVFAWRWIVYAVFRAAEGVKAFRHRTSPRKFMLACAVLTLVISVPVVIALSADAPSPAFNSDPLIDAESRANEPPEIMLSLAASQIIGEANEELDALQDDFTPAPEPAATPTPVPHPSNTVISHGMNAPVVEEIQLRLMELGFMEADEPTDYYGNITRGAIKYFQRQHGLDEDGMVGMETFTMLTSPEAQHYTVMQGASGEDVTELQTRLYELGYMEHVTGYFGDETLGAVKKFQSYNNLTSDGKVGSKTREMLYSASANAYFLKYGEKSDEVKGYQERLRALGYLTTTPDGVYGKDTVAAVKRFQEQNGMISDGFLGPSTVKALKSSSAKANALVFGMSGADVENVQKLLKNLGYMSSVTGYFGSQTEEAVKAFQKNNKLSSDGTVGKNTMTALTSSGAKKASSSSGGGSSSSSENSKLEKFISAAEGKLGSKYVFGAKGPSTFDCSGFVYYCLNKAGVNQSYMTSSGWASSTKYEKIKKTSDLKRGDVLVFKGHVGIYLGKGVMIDASSGKGKVVKRADIWNSSYWNKNFICGFRIF